MKRIAVLLTCHNRREQTLACLASLGAQQLPADLQLETWLVDDGSSDGTASAVAQIFPAVHLLAGDGRLFWSGGMRLATEQAAVTDPDFMLWLNDDVRLDAGAVALLQTTWRELAAHEAPPVIVGSCRAGDGPMVSYGGLRRTGRHPARLERLNPGSEPQRCDTFEGNCVLISRDVFSRLGPPKKFRHAMADTDYGYRAWRAGCSVWLTAGTIGCCPPQRAGSLWRQPAVPLGRRWRAICGSKGLPPLDWMRFLRAHAGWRWPFYWLATYLQALRGR